MIAKEYGRLGHLVAFRYVLRGFLSFSEEAAEREGIHVQQYQLMQVIATAEDPATIAYVAERMYLKHNSAVELVGRAVEEGLILRKRDPLDARKAIVKLTPRGDRILMRLAGQHIQELERVGPELKRTLEQVLSK